MTSLRQAAQQALEAMSSFKSGTNGLYEGEFAEEMAALKAALADGDKSSPGEPVAWYHVPYPNNGAAPMVSLSKQHEPSMYGAVVPLFLGAPYDQTSLELCEVCGWKTLIPGDCCLNCARINCASLQDQNTELDRKLAEMEAKLNNPSVDDAFRILAEANRRAIDYINELERQINELKQKAEPVNKKRKPLSEAKISSLFRTAGSPLLFARAIERAHSIRGHE